MAVDLAPYGVRVTGHEDCPLSYRQRVRLDDADVRVVADHAPQGPDKSGVDLDRHDTGTGLAQGQRETPEARPHVADEVAGTDAGVTHHLAHRVGVDDEALPAGPAGRETVLGEQPLDVGGGEQPGAHNSTRTRITPAEGGASSAKASRFRSITRPSTNGPRSLMRTSTLRPFARFVTVTTDPRGSDG